MWIFSTWKNTLILCFGLLVLVSCSSPTSTPVADEAATVADITDPTTTNEPALEITETPEPTVDNSTPTPDLRTPPEEWQKWPIVPDITNRSYAIFATGQQNQVSIHSFSKIGDCQNVKEAFLGIYDKEGRYFLREDETDWQTTIDNFNGFFDRDGEAIEQGLNVAAALSPLHANPDTCQANESPLMCELRVANPGFAFVSFERWWPDETPPEVYEQYLRIVIQTIIDYGTVPILVTKADNIEGDHRINLIIAKLAFEYDVPLYNWWRAAQFLPNQGMDPERNDGFHISFEAWDTRSYYALETLDHLWKGLTNQS